MTINTPNRALIERTIDCSAPEPFTDWELSDATLNRLLDAARAEGPVQGDCYIKPFPEPKPSIAKSVGGVTPLGDEVGRGLRPDDLAWLATLRHEITYDPFGARGRENARIDRILSHVSRLEDGRAWQQRQINDTENRAETAEAYLKLAVEALEPFARWAEVFTCLLDAEPISAKSKAFPALEASFTAKDFRGAREALRSIRSPIRGSDLESASQSASPPLRPDTKPKTTQYSAPQLRPGDWTYDGQGMIWAPSLKGGATKIADVRGWGYLTGSGHGALGLPQDEAIKTQNEWGATIVCAVNAYCAALSAADYGLADGERSEVRSPIKPPLAPTNMDTSGQSGGEG